MVIHESRKSSAHPSDAFCLGKKISISMESIQKEIFIPTQNASFECTVGKIIGMLYFGRHVESAAGYFYGVKNAAALIDNSVKDGVQSAAGFSI